LALPPGIVTITSPSNHQSLLPRPTYLQLAKPAAGSNSSPTKLSPPSTRCFLRGSLLQATRSTAVRSHPPASRSESLPRAPPALCSVRCASSTRSSHGPERNPIPVTPLYTRLRPPYNPRSGASGKFHSPAFEAESLSIINVLLGHAPRPGFFAQPIRPSSRSPSRQPSRPLVSSRQRFHVGTSPPRRPRQRCRPPRRAPAHPRCLPHEKTFCLPFVLQTHLSETASPRKSWQVFSHLAPVFSSGQKIVPRPSAAISRNTAEPELQAAASPPASRPDLGSSNCQSFRRQPDQLPAPHFHHFSTGAVGSPIRRCHPLVTQQLVDQILRGCRVILKLHHRVVSRPTPQQVLLGRRRASSGFCSKKP